MSPERPANAVAVILGSAFHSEGLAGVSLVPQDVETPFGSCRLHRVEGLARPAYVLFRHGDPHRYLPNQIPYRAHTWALRSLGVGALLVTSSVGVLDRDVPLNRLLLVDDLMMLENRLPDGSACTMFTEPSADHGHLVLNDGLFSTALSAQVEHLVAEAGVTVAGRVVFGYVGGPRTKTKAENRMWARLGAQVNSMTLAPEVVLANEVGIACAGLVVGHKYSVPGVANPEKAGLAATLDAARTATEQAVRAFLEQTHPVPFTNHLFRFG